MSDTYTNAIWRQPGYDLAGTNQSAVALQGNVAALSLYGYYDLAPMLLQDAQLNTTCFCNLPVNQFTNTSSSEIGDVVYLSGTVTGNFHIVALKVHYNQSSLPSNIELLWDSNVGSISNETIPTICPASVGGQENIYINYNNNIYSVDATTGNKTKLTAHDEISQGLNPVFFDGVSSIYSIILDTSSKIFLYKFNLSGGLIWASPSLGTSSSSLIMCKMIHNGTYIYLAFYAGLNYLFRINDNNGTILNGPKIIPDGLFLQIAFNNSVGTLGGTLYLLNTFELISYDFTTTNTLSTLVISAGVNNGVFAIRKSDNVLFNVTSGLLQAITTNNLGVMSVSHSTGSTTQSHVIIDSNDNIIFLSDSGLHIYTYSLAGGFVEIFNNALPIPSDSGYPPSIGYNGLLYLTSKTPCLFYAYGTGFVPTTTTTTTTPAPTTTTTTTGTPTTTTTTTTLSPFAVRSIKLTDLLTITNRDVPIERNIRSIDINQIDGSYAITEPYDSNGSYNGRVMLFPQSQTLPVYTPIEFKTFDRVGSLYYPQDARIDYIRGDLWIADTGNNRVLKVDINTKKTHINIEDSLVYPYALALDLNTGNIFIKGYTDLTMNYGCISHYSKDGTLLDTFVFNTTVLGDSSSSSSESLSSESGTMSDSTSSSSSLLVLPSFPSAKSIAFDNSRSRLWWIDDKVHIYMADIRGKYVNDYDLSNNGFVDLNNLDIEMATGNAFITARDNHLMWTIAQVNRDCNKFLSKAWVL